jgi:mycofactocin precursor
MFMRAEVAPAESNEIVTEIKPLDNEQDLDKLIDGDLLIEEVSIDGMCGVY